MTWKATHTVPAGGLQTIVNNQPSTPLAAGLEVEVAETSGQWARVIASNGWQCWVDARTLIPIAAAPVVAPAVLGAGPPPAPSGPPPGPYPVSNQPSAVPTWSAARPPKARRIPRTTVIISVLVVVLLAGGAGGYFLVRAQATDVTLEMATAPSADPFVPATVAARPAPVLPRTGPGGTPIYGGTGNNGVCDKLALTEFLTAHNAQANAWASVEGISLLQIPDFIRQLEPEVLSRDVRVTNHGFISGGGPSSFQSVFQAGTAVLVNQFGYPVVRCLNGSPLTPPISTKARYVGQQWQGFNQTTITILVAPPGNVPNIPTVVTKGNDNSATWNGTYSIQPSSVTCTGSAPSSAFDSVLNQAVPQSGLVVSGNSIPGPSGTIPIDPNGQAKIAYPVASVPGSTVSGTFSFARDANGGASVSGSVDVAVELVGTNISEKCSLPFKGTRTTSGGTSSIPTLDPTIAKNDGAAYHRIVNADMPAIDTDQRNLTFRCDQPLSPPNSPVTCRMSGVDNALHDSENFLSDINTVPVPPGYALGDGKLRQGLKDELVVLAALGKGTSRADFEAGINSYAVATAMMRNGIALLPPA